MVVWGSLRPPEEHAFEKAEFNSLKKAIDSAINSPSQDSCKAMVRWFREVSEDKNGVSFLADLVKAVKDEGVAEDSCPEWKTLTSEV